MTNDEKQAALAAIQKINAVEGFDPTPLAVEYTDMNTKQTRLRLPVVVQMAWFRLKYPEGRVAVSVAPGKDCFVATARVYHHFTDPVDQFLSEATASRGYLADKPTVSPREWAQTAAVGVALRNAGFGLQFGAVGDSVDTPAVDELGGILWSDGVPGEQPDTNVGSTSAPVAEPTPPPPAPDTESPLEKALKVLCPINKHKGKTLGEVLNEDPGAINWVATKYKGDAAVSEAAKLICEQAMQSIA